MSATFDAPGPCQSQSAKRNFGICDDQNATPAYLDEENGDTWIAEVHKGDERVITFVAIDHCIDLRRPDGNLDNRCDGMLIDGPTVVFVELKERREGGWVSEGIGQLAATIQRFEAATMAHTFTQKLAYVANGKRPRFNGAQTNPRQDFLDATGYVLDITPHIRL